jgi:GNAT superfamily N-acetyltransferase
MTKTALMTKNERVEWVVRPATINDRNKINQLLKESYSDLLRQDYDDETLSIALPALTSARDELLTCGTWYVVHHPDDSSTLVGCGGWTKQQPKKSETSISSTVPHLRHFATHPSATRQGVASALWKQTWEDITQICGPDTSLEVFSTLTAVPFYASLGFVPIKNMSEFCWLVKQPKKCGSTQSGSFFLF